MITPPETLMRQCKVWRNWMRMSLSIKHGRRLKWLVLGLILVVLVTCNYLGVYAYLFAQDYYTKFTYPLEGNIEHYIDQIKAGKNPDVKPITNYNYSFVLSNDTKCLKLNGKQDDIRLMILVKSAIKNRANRDAIRQSWGWEKRFSDVKIRTVFLLGVDSSTAINSVQKEIEEEHKKYGDIVQSNFTDSYFNNTIKTMQGFLWVVKKCPSAEFILFSDDDMYTSIKNVLRFVRNPLNYPVYLTRAILQDIEPINIDDSIEMLFSGYVFFSAPLRLKYSKWHITLEEYRFSKYPPYIAAGSYVLSQDALFNLYYTSLYTQHFRFDDVYLGLVAKKAGITPLHNSNFHFWKKNYDRSSYKYVISSHGYGDVNELLKIWHEQRALGNA